jgi:MtN3 and saliva related transmembrane protein
MIEIGVAGVVLLLAAWLLETIDSIKKRRPLVEMKFALIYVVSTALLTLYAYQENDFIFFSVNFCIILLVLFEIAYTIYKRK